MALQQITFTNKNTGDNFTATEVNEIKSVVNNNASELQTAGTLSPDVILQTPEKQFINSAGIAALNNVISSTGQITTRAFFPNSVKSQSTSETSATYRVRYEILGKGSNLQLVYFNGYVDGATEVSIPSSITIKARVRYRDTNIPVYFKNSRTTILESGAYIVSDLVGINVDPDLAIPLFVDTFVDAGATPTDTTKMWPLNYNLYPSWTEGLTNGTDLTGLSASAPTTVGNNSTIGFGPSAILANIPLRKVVTVAGDSIATGQGDAGGNGVVNWRDDLGFFRRAFEPNNIPFVRISKPGDISVGFNGLFAGRNRKILLNLSKCTDFIDQLGINDVPTGITLVNLKAAAIERWNAIKAMGIRVYATTLTPRVASSDYLRTTVNQTPNVGCGSGGVRTQYNDWIRAGADGLLTGHIEIADVFETSRNSGIWKIATVLHTGTVTSATSTTLTQTFAGWTVDEFAGKRVAITSGTGFPQSSSDLPRTILSNTEDTLTLISGQAFVPSLDSTSTFVIESALANDGTHPSSDGAKLAALAINTDLFI